MVPLGADGDGGPTAEGDLFLTWATDLGKRVIVRHTTKSQHRSQLSEVINLIGNVQPYHDSSRQPLRT